MGRALRNVFRKKVRTLFVILIIGFCLGIFITMSIVNENISNRTQEISSNSATGITISPAGTGGGYGGFGRPGDLQQTMNESILPKVQAVSHIKSIQKIITHQEGTFDRSTGTMPTMVQGQDPSQPLILRGGGTLTITSGNTLESSDSSANVALIGLQYSTDKGVDVKDTITLNGTSIVVKGIYTTGTRFGDNSIILPYNTAKKVYGITGMNEVYVNVDYAGNVESVVTALRSALGPDYDVIDPSTMETAIQNSINSVLANSETGLVISLITGVAVMIFVMILITRERTKEIGVLKAIGFKNSSIVAQFFTESVFLAVLGFVVGLILVMAAGPSLANMMLGTSGGGSRGGPGGGFRGMGGEFSGRIDFTLQPTLTIYALVLAIILGIIGSVYPILKAISLKPAEALRYE